MAARQSCAAGPDRSARRPQDHDQRRRRCAGRAIRVDVYAFRVQLAPAGRSIDIEFDYLSPTSARVGELEISRELAILDWNELVLYPAGYYARRIPVDAGLTLPADGQLGLGAGGQSEGARTALQARRASKRSSTVPSMPGRYAARLDLDPGGAAPRASRLVRRPRRICSRSRPEQLAAHRALVQQAYKLFGSRHFAHYDFLYSLSDQVQQMGLEHLAVERERHRSRRPSPSGTRPPIGASLLPHEFSALLERQVPPARGSVDSEFQRADAEQPAVGLRGPDPILGGGAGGAFRTVDQGAGARQLALDGRLLRPPDRAALARIAGHDQRPIVNPRRPMSWRDWQRFEDYYARGRD